MNTEKKNDCITKGAKHFFFRELTANMRFSDSKMLQSHNAMEFMTTLAAGY